MEEVGQLAMQPNRSRLRIRRTPILEKKGEMSTTTKRKTAEIITVEDADGYDAETSKKKKQKTNVEDDDSYSAETSKKKKQKTNVEDDDGSADETAKKKKQKTKVKEMDSIWQIRSGFRPFCTTMQR